MGNCFLYFSWDQDSRGRLGRVFCLLEWGLVVWWTVVDSFLKVWGREWNVWMWKFMKEEKSPKRTRSSKIRRAVGFMCPKQIQEFKKEMKVRWIEFFINWPFQMIFLSNNFSVGHFWLLILGYKNKTIKILICFIKSGNARTWRGGIYATGK